MVTREQLINFYRNHPLPTEIDPAYRDETIDGLRICGEDDQGLPVRGSQGTQRYRLVGYPNNTDNLLPLPENHVPHSATFPNPGNELIRRYLSATGGLRYEEPGSNGNRVQGVLSLCRGRSLVGSGDTARFPVFLSNNAILNHRNPGVPGLMALDIPLQPHEIVAIVGELHGPDGNVIRIPDEHYGINASQPSQLSVFPDDVELGRVIAGIRRPDSPIAPGRRQAIIASINRILDGEQRRMARGQAAGQREGLQMQRAAQSEQRWLLVGMTSANALISLIAIGKGASVKNAVTIFPRMILTPPVETLINGVRLLARQPVRWGYTVKAFGDAHRIFTKAGRHRATLDSMTIDATEKARRYQAEYRRAYESALEEIRRTHGSLSDVERTDRARGAARNSLQGSFPEYVAADEILHSIDLGLRSSNPEERADAEGRLGRIREAENTMVQAKNANPVFVDVKGTGKSIRMHAIVLRSVRGESSVPPNAIQRRGWRELSRRGLMGTSEGDSAKFVGNLETNVQKLVDALNYFHGRGEPHGLIIDEIHSFFGDRDVDPHVSKALQIIKGPMAVDNTISVLGATTPEEWTEVTSDKAMADRLRAIRFDPTNQATMRLALRARLLTISPDALSRPDIDATLTRLIDSSFQLEGEYSPRRALDIALPAIVTNGDLSVDGVDRYFRNEKQMRIREVVTAVTGRFEPIAVQARLTEALHPGSSGGPMPDADLRERVISEVMEVCQKKGWMALLNAEGAQMVTNSFNQTRAILSSTSSDATSPPPPPPHAPEPVALPTPQAPAPTTPEDFTAEYLRQNPDYDRPDRRHIAETTAQAAHALWEAETRGSSEGSSAPLSREAIGGYLARASTTYENGLANAALRNAAAERAYVDLYGSNGRERLNRLREEETRRRAETEARRSTSPIGRR